MSNENMALPPPSDPSTPLDLTPTPTPPPGGERDPVIQRSAVFGTRYLTDPEKVYDFNSWDQVLPDPDHIASSVEKIAFQKQHRLADKDRARFLDRPAYFWDMFYLNNRENFFKNRKWLTREFPALKACLAADAGAQTILEAGCGVGNAIFPLLEENENPDLRVHGRDYSPRAIEVLKEDSQFDPVHCTAGVWDISSTEGPEGIEDCSVDVILLCFCLSALVCFRFRGVVLIGRNRNNGSRLYQISIDY
jgi:tRNAThr (cytosine32-N3)-methyltransferase